MSTHVIATFDEKEPDFAAHQRLLVIIPAYNEEDSLGRVIRNVQTALPQADILVVNDGSVDATPEIADGYCVRVASLPYNLGIGSAMQTGFMFARDYYYDVAVQVDGDGQHDPVEISELVSPLIQGTADVVIGSRYIEDRGYITPKLRRLGILILSGIISLLVGQKMTDPTSGFRAMNRRAIYFCSSDYPFDYPEPESVVTLKRAGLCIAEVPVTMNPRYGGQSSITPLHSGYYMVKVIMSIFIGLLRQRPEAVREVQIVHEHPTS
ncbi:MAG: glycosyltransferase family 2 protein [Anaerolineae bacterium]|nr:glycosyltransferase family 2 protein [Anaerolineae bacterium]